MGIQLGVPCGVGAQGWAGEEGGSVGASVCGRGREHRFPSPPAAAAPQELGFEARVSPWPLRGLSVASPWPTQALAKSSLWPQDPILWPVPQCLLSDAVITRGCISH